MTRAVCQRARPPGRGFSATGPPTVIRSGRPHRQPVNSGLTAGSAEWALEIASLVSPAALECRHPGYTRAALCRRAAISRGVGGEMTCVCATERGVCCSKTMAPGVPA